MNIGVSPSGKAQDFDSCTRQFKSGHPSQYKGTPTWVSLYIGWLDYQLKWYPKCLHLGRVLNLATPARKKHLRDLWNALRAWNTLRVWNALRRVRGIYFISHRTEPKAAWDISQFPQGNYFTFGASRIFHFFFSHSTKTVDRFEPPLLKYLQNCGIIHIVKKRGSH